MTLECRPEVTGMEFFEAHVNSHCRAPACDGEPFLYVLPQKFNPNYMSKSARKKQQRQFEVQVLFVAKTWCGGRGNYTLKWAYEDIRVMELV